jgi:uncharacterized protein (DUF58 family)
VVDGFMFGIHPSRLPGPGLEFSQYRGYQPGDDLRRVDWRLFARADRYWVREADTATSITLRLVLDTSASMAQAEDGLTKLDYARLVAAALALLALRQGDAVGLYALSDRQRILPRSACGACRVFHLWNLARGGVARLARLGGSSPSTARGLTVLISDCASGRRSGRSRPALPGMRRRGNTGRRPPTSRSTRGRPPSGNGQDSASSWTDAAPLRLPRR